MLPASRVDLACCHEISGFACFAGLLGIFQVAVQWSCFAIMYVHHILHPPAKCCTVLKITRLLLFLVYFPTATALSPSKSPKAEPSYRVALAVAGICVTHTFATAVLNMVFINRFPTHLQSYANVLGLLATVLASIQYLPQLYTTWRLKTVGSLSIPMMGIQTPGSFLWAGSLAARVGWEGWSTWFVYVVTGLLQGCVLGMGIVYELRVRKKRNLSSDEDNVDGENESSQEIEGQASPTHETTPLLGNER